MHNGHVTRPIVSVTGGKALYEGRQLVEWATEIARLIAEQFDVDRIVLFGSVARGDDGPDSDIDLLVVLPIVDSRHNDAVRILTALRHLPVPIDLVVVDSTRLDEQARIPGIVRVAMREGKTLWQSTTIREPRADG
jgi:uncharacterized protein